MSLKLPTVAALSLPGQLRTLRKADVLRSARSVNPLPIGVSLADITVVREGDLFLFGMGSSAWVSSGVVNWKYQAVGVKCARLPVTPHVAKYHGAFYTAPDQRICVNLSRIGTTS